MVTLLIGLVIVILGLAGVYLVSLSVIGLGLCAAIISRFLDVDRAANQLMKKLAVYYALVICLVLGGLYLVVSSAVSLILG